LAKRETWLKNKPFNYHSSIADIVKAVNKENFDKFSKYEVEFILKWQNIFDKNIGKNTGFKKIFFENQNAKTATLFVNVHPANMLEISYSEGLMQEQIANYFGFKLIERIKFFADYNFGTEKADKEYKIINKKPFANTENLHKISSEISSKINDEFLQTKLTELYKNL
jgi:hypothetical protein